MPLLIAAGAGAVVVIVAIVMTIIHFSSRTPDVKTDASAQKHTSPGRPAENVNPGTTLEDRLAEIWNLYTQYASAHDGQFPATLEEAGHPELRSGIDSKRGINFDLGVRNLKLCKAPLPAKMIVATGLGLRDASNNLTDVVLFGDGQIQTLDKQAFQKASQESSSVEVDAYLWLGSDPSTPTGAVTAWFVAMGMGNPQALKTLTCNVNEDLVEAAAAQKAASREFLAAAVARFPSANHAEPRPAKTQTDIARYMINLIRGGPETITGDTAEVGSGKPFQLKKIDGAWRLDARPFFDFAYGVQAKLATMIFQINARATREVTQEIAQGKYADWPAAKQAVLDRMKAFATADELFQQTVKAHRDVKLPSFAMVAPWDIQQDLRAQIAQAPATTPEVVQAKPAPVARAENPAPPAVQSSVTKTTSSDLRKTAMVGGNGGGPFSSPGDGEKLVRGFRYWPGHWNGPVIGHFSPLYDAAGNDPPAPGLDPKTAKNILAREGYAVGGLIADFDDVNFFAFRVIFLREKDGLLDRKDQYTSEWIGTPAGKHQQQLAGDGETIVGIFGRQGMNCDAIGLLEKPPKATDATKAASPK